MLKNIFKKCVNFSPYNLVGGKEFCLQELHSYKPSILGMSYLAYAETLITLFQSSKQPVQFLDT